MAVYTESKIKLLTTQLQWCRARNRDLLAKQQRSKSSLFANAVPTVESTLGDFTALSCDRVEDVAAVFAGIWGL
jgi:hypothetical protein